MRNGVDQDPKYLSYLQTVASLALGLKMSIEEAIQWLNDCCKFWSVILPRWEIRAVVSRVWRKPIPPPIQFPEGIISGVAGSFADLYCNYLESPRQFFYISFLTCLGSLLANRLTLASEIAPQPRLYLLILGESADARKSTGGQKALDFFTEYFPKEFAVCYGVGSAEGLQKNILAAPEQRVVLYFDEFKAFVSKCSPEASVLLPCVNTLFESNRYETQTKHSRIVLQGAHLSIIGCSTTETYETMWKPQFLDIGFCNRVFLLPGSAVRRFSIPRIIPKAAKDDLKKRLDQIISLVGKRMEMPITDDALMMFHRWYMKLEKSIHAKRLDTYAHRFMPLMAINEGKTQVDSETVTKVLDLVDWQLGVRRLHDPIDADNEIARMEEKIRRNLEGGELTERDLKRNTNYKRSGLWVFQNAIENLEKAREIEKRHFKRSTIWRLSSGLSS